MIAKIDPTAKIAIVYADDDFDRMVANGTLTYAKRLGLNVVFYQSFPTSIQDFTPILTSLAAAHPDIILGATHYSDGLLLTQQLASLKINAKLIALTVAPSDPRYYENLGVLAEGVAFPSQWELGVKYSPDAAKAAGAVWFGPTPDEFYKLFLNVSGGVTPSYESASSAAAVLILVKAIEAAQSLDQAAVRAALNNLTLMTFFGLFKIDPATGYQIGHSMVVGQWQHGQKVIIWPPSAATASPLYPIPSWDSKFANLTKTS
jgi:branched-chain amino acid transport system substrate-binding protein